MGILIFSSHTSQLNPIEKRYFVVENISASIYDTLYLIASIDLGYLRLL